MFLQSHKTTRISPRAISNPRSLVFILMVVGSASLLTSCVKSENEFRLELPVQMKCAENGSISAGDTPITGIKISLQNYLANGPLLFSREEEDTSVTPPKKKLVYRYQGAGFPVEVAAIITGSISSTTSNAQIGAGQELRIDQNAFRPEKITYTIVDDKYKLGKIADKDVPGNYINGVQKIPGIPFLEYKELKKWDTILQAKAGGQPAIFTITIEAQIQGTLTGGTKQKTSATRFLLQLLVNSPDPSSPVCDAPGGK